MAKERTVPGERAIEDRDVGGATEDTAAVREVAFSRRDVSAHDAAVERKETVLIVDAAAGLIGQIATDGARRDNERPCRGGARAEDATAVAGGVVDDLRIQNGNGRVIAG